MKNLSLKSMFQKCLPIIIFFCLWNASSEEEYQKILGSDIDLNSVSINNNHEQLLKERFLQKPELILQTDMGRQAVQWARGLLNEQKTIPLTTYTLYREFQRTGDRGKYENPYFMKRTMLTAATLLIYFEKDDSMLSLANDLIWSICEETSWVLPAHERTEKYTYVDLFSAETATQLAHTLLFLEDKLPKEIQQRIRYEVKKRVMQPYLFYSEKKYGWVQGRNNWTGVCAGSVGECFLILENNEKILRKAVTMVTNQLVRFLQNGFAEDGGCLEGISYWNYGLTHYVSFSELLYEATGGKVNLICNPRMYQIAFYPYVVYLGNGQFASFSDAPSKFYPESFITHRLAERFSAYDRLSNRPQPFIYHKLGEQLSIDYLHGLANPIPTDWLFGNVVRNIFWSYPYANQKPPEIPIESVYLPKSGIAKIVVKDNGGNVHILLCKAGSNSEPHNHNDVGSFIYVVNDDIFLTDPGAGLYSKEYFSPKRYENIFANSYGHSLPVIAGKLQSAGEKFKGELVYEATNKVTITFHAAYDIPSLKKAERIFILENNSLKMTDSFEFSDKGKAIEEALITWLPVTIKNNIANIEGQRGIISIAASDGKFDVESLKQQCEANHCPGELSRIKLNIPARTKSEVSFNINYIKK
ncbi:MAG TPA: heparinase II/III family protein [Candidatus Hydrogenedens sp.]|nr:heparinase II/III family protein [Candidatus Hydrogenedens sp.]